MTIAAVASTANFFSHKNNMPPGPAHFGERFACLFSLPRAVLTVGLALGLALACAPALALNLDDYQHSRWTQENGGPPEIRAMAQTTDGWLWLATVDGLFRFDGIAFERFTMPGPYSPTRSRVESVYAHDNGDLYITYFGQGLSVLHPDGRSEDLGALPNAPPSVVLAMAVDDDGGVWAFGATIHHFSGGRWTEMEHGPDWVGSIQYSALLDQNGRLWAANENGVWRLDRARARFDRVSATGGGLSLAPNGDVWLMADKGKATRLAPAAAGARRKPDIDAQQSRFGGIFDGDGTLWGLDCPERLCLVRGAAQQGDAGLLLKRDATDRIGASAILSGQDAGMLLQDREGDMWLAGSAGLERFRAKRVLGAGLERGGNAYTLASDAAGQVWAGDRIGGVLWRLSPGRAPERDPARDVGLLATDRDGALLIGGKRSIERRARGGVEQIPLPPGPDGKPVDMHIIGMLDDGKVLWTATPETGLIGWNGSKWLPKKAFNLPDYIYLVSKGGPGQLWLATKNGELALYDNGRITRHDARAVGLGSGIFPGPDLTMGGDLGFAVLKDGAFHPLRARDPAALRNVSGVVIGADGDRWLNGAAGVVHVRADDWRRAMDHPDQLLRYELIDVLDGYPGQAALDTRLPSAISADGRHMWFLGTGGVVMLDSAALRRNTVAPEPKIREVVTAAGSFPAAPALRIAPGFQQLRINFTASALRNPERVRFQYRLDGFDRDWQDAGSRRMTLYTNVDPGSYVFRVRAINEDGVASRKDAAMRLEIEPTLVQSLPFRLACVLLLAALATMLYRYRVRYLTSRLMERVVIKTAERERCTIRSCRRCRR